MGRQRSKKHRALELAAKRKPVRADDYFRFGPFEFARFGRLAVGRTNMSDRQFAELQDHLVRRFPEVCREIDDKVSRIVASVTQLPPKELLTRAYWEMAARHIDVESEVDIDEETAVSVRMVDYVQSIIAAAPRSQSVKRTVTDEDWKELRSLVAGLFWQLNYEYPSCRSAADGRANPHYDIDFDEYYAEAQLYWCNVRGTRYLVHQIASLRPLLSPHSDVLHELFGVTAEALLDGLQAIQDSLTLGLGKAMDELRQFREVTLDALEKKIEQTTSTSKNELPDLMTQVIQENGWESWRDDVFGRLFGLDLFELEKICQLPLSLIDEMSWGPGQETEFLAEGAYKGWPLRVWPIFKRPFIRLEDRHYCFDLYGLFDHVYRSIQRLITRKRPTYQEIWNERQKLASESLPCELLGRLLPGAQSYRSVHYPYPWHADHDCGKQWRETDALVLAYDHLFIIEVKGGAFTHTPPATDFGAYVDSLRNLLVAPSQQGLRFLQYLQSDDEVPIYDRHHTEVGRLRSGDFAHVTVCAVTLDPFTELAARAEHLKAIGIDAGERAVWPLSVDDLRVYAHVFSNPLTFLHYVEQRMRAAQSRFIRVDDEMDHLGLYLRHNNYLAYARQLSADTRIQWHGYRLPIDRYFSKLIKEPNSVNPLRQGMPRRLLEMLDVLRAGNKPGCRKVSSMLLDHSGELRTRLASGIDEALREQAAVRRPKPLSLHGEVKVTLFCWQEGVVARDEKLAADHARAVMLAANDDQRLLLELFLDAAGRLVDVDFAFFEAAAMPESERMESERKADELKRRRVRAAIAGRGKLGRNEPCPCGSGRKYKRCCIALRD